MVAQSDTNRVHTLALWTLRGIALPVLDVKAGGAT